VVKTLGQVKARIPFARCGFELPKYCENKRVEVQESKEIETDDAISLALCDSTFLLADEAEGGLGRYSATEFWRS
jgi:hypothetical protein